MHRRTLLVAVAGLSGCTSLVGDPLGGTVSSGEPEASGDVGGSSETTSTDSDSDDTATRVDGPSGVADSDPTPSPADLRRMSVDDLLALAREQLSRAIEVYVDTDRGASLTAVTAATDRFAPEPVVDHLYRARRAYEVADRQGLSGDDQAEIARLERLDTLLRLSIDAQVFHIEAHNDLEGVVTAIDFLDPETARSLTTRAGTRQRGSRRTITDLSNTRYERSVNAVDAFSRDEYFAKRDQFRAENAVLGDLTEALGPVVDGVTLFAQARGRRQNGAPYAAASLAKDAETAFDRGVKALREVARGVPRQAQGFNGVAAALVTATDDRRVEARAFYRGIEQ